MGLREPEGMQFDPNDYLDASVLNVPDSILRPIHRALNHGNGWHDLIKQAEKIDSRFIMKDYQVAEISRAVMAFSGIDTCSDRLIREYGHRCMTLKELADCLFATGKFEKALLDSNIKSSEPLEIEKQPPENVDVMARTRLEIICEASGFPYPRYTWFKGDEEVGVIASIDGKLTIPQITEEQAGNYICRVHNSNKECIFSERCEVKVLENPHPPTPEPPANPQQLTPVLPHTDATHLPQVSCFRDFTLKITWPTQEQALFKKFGEQLRLVCNAEGSPSPNFQWYRNNEPLPNHTHSCLYIQSTKFSDSGTYHCQASNSVHQPVISPQFKVNVSDSKQKESLSIVEHPSSMSIEEGAAQVILTCRASGSGGQIVYKWFHNSGEIICSGDDYTIMKGELKIERLVSKHSGEYMCLVELHHGTTGELLSSKRSNIAQLDIKLSNRNFKRPHAKVALLIGNSNYRNEVSRLPAVINDMDATKAVLEKELDFKVLSFIDLTLHEMFTAVNLFCEFVNDNTYVLVYFAGHGFADCRYQYLMPFDAPQGASANECLCMDEVHVEIMKKNPALCVVVKDVCHSISQNPSTGAVKPIINPVKGKSYIINTASFGEKSFEKEMGEQRGIFNDYFVDIIQEDLPVKRAFDRILEKFREYLAQFGSDYPMHPCVTDDLIQHQRSLRDPVDPDDMDTKLRDQLQHTWQDYHKLPAALAKIEADTYRLKLATTFQVRHTNWFVMNVAVEDLGVFNSCHIELHAVPTEIHGPKLNRRRTKTESCNFLFDFKDIQRLKSALQPEMYVVCYGNNKEKKELSAPLIDNLLMRPLISHLGNWRQVVHPTLRRVPTETEEESTSIGYRHDKVSEFDPADSNA